MVEEGYFSSCGYRIKQEDPVFYLLGVGRASHVPDADPYEVVSIITDEVAYRNRVNKSDSLKVRIFRHEYIASEITKDTPLMVEQIYPAMGGAPLEQRLVIVTQGEPAPKPGMLN